MDAKLPRATIVFPHLVTVHFDGACQPPKGGGIATYGFTVDGEGFEDEEKGLAVPPWSVHSTNNVAEYVAAIRALEWLVEHRHRGPVLLLGDSQLVVRQMNGEYEVRAPHLKAYHERLAQLASQFPETQFRWIPRGQNLRADELSKEAFEDHASGTGRHRPPGPVEVPPEDDVEDSGESSPRGT
ncbi:MAG: ribonuclease HI family protein [Thermoplasmata archaeon]|nr:ribonuclease HI family protein [Thermoplasmata archaeon]